MPAASRAAILAVICVIRMNVFDRADHSSGLHRGPIYLIEVHRSGPASGQHYEWVRTAHSGVWRLIPWAWYHGMPCLLIISWDVAWRIAGYHIVWYAISIASRHTHLSGGLDDFSDLERGNV